MERLLQTRGCAAGPKMRPASDVKRGRSMAQQQRRGRTTAVGQQQGRPSAAAEPPHRSSHLSRCSRWRPWRPEGPSGRSGRSGPPPPPPPVGLCSGQSGVRAAGNEPLRTSPLPAHSTAPLHSTAGLAGRTPGTHTYPAKPRSPPQPAWQHCRSPHSCTCLDEVVLHERRPQQERLGAAQVLLPCSTTGSTQFRSALVEWPQV